MENRQELIRKLDACMELGVEEGVFPGANYALVIDGQTYYGSFGNRALIPRIEKNHLDTIYDIASLTKVVGTTTAVLKLMEMGKLSLEDRLSDYLEYIKDEHVTLRDLMTHSSGYPALTPETETMTSVKPLLEDLRNCRLEYETGTKVIYSDVGFMYLGFVVEKLTGSMPAFLDREVFEPLGMVDTCYNHKHISRIAPTEEFGFRGLIRGMVHDEKAFLLDGVAGHAGLYATVSDLSIFAKMLLNGGVYEGKRILEETSINLIRQKIIVEINDYRSIGWAVKQAGGHDVVYHTGFTGTSLNVDFEKNMAFILLSNRVHPTRENIKIRPFRGKVDDILYENL